MFYNAAALSYASMQNNLDGINILNQALKLHKNNFLILNNLGLLNSNLNNNKIARQYYDKALSINENFIDALVNKEIAGAGLDVFETEPNLPSELKTLENVVSFPHLGSATIETRIAMGDTAINNALAFFEDKDLPNKVV